MTISKLVIAVFLFVSAAGACRANIGEAEAQCLTRYGSEFDVTTDVGYRQVGDKAASFNLKTPSGSMIVRVTFLRGLSCHESFSNADSSRGLTEDQMKAILDSQNAGLKWRKGRTVYHTDGSGETYGSVDWLRSDGATAKFWVSGKAASQNQSGQVELSTEEYTHAQHFYDKENGDN